MHFLSFKVPFEELVITEMVVNPGLLLLLVCCVLDVMSSLVSMRSSPVPAKASSVVEVDGQ